jgi:adenosylhomocysteine nucleosidase
MMALSVALMAEAKPLIQSFHLKEQPQTKGYRIWENQEMLLIVTGVGKLSSAAATSFLLGKHSEISFFVNIGIAGHATLPLGSLLLANKIIDASEGKSFYPTLLLHAPCETLCVTTLAKPSKEYREDSCFDTESSGFFQAASKFLSPECIQVIKIISDNLSSSHLMVSEKKVSERISSLEGEIHNLLSLLRKSTQEPAIPHKPIPSDYLEKWHFTHSEKEKLQDILYRIEALQPKKDNEDFSHCKTAEELLARLEEKAKKLPIFCPIKKPVS